MSGNQIIDAKYHLKLIEVMLETSDPRNESTYLAESAQGRSLWTRYSDIVAAVGYLEIGGYDKPSKAYKQHVRDRIPALKREVGPRALSVLGPLLTSLRQERYALVRAERFLTAPEQHELAMVDWVHKYRITANGFIYTDSNTVASYCLFQQWLNHLYARHVLGRTSGPDIIQPQPFSSLVDPFPNAASASSAASLGETNSAHGHLVGLSERRLRMYAL